MSGKLLALTLTYQDGRTHSKMINTSQVVEIEADPREGAPSKTIIKTVDGRKLYCTNTYDDVMAQYNG